MRKIYISGTVLPEGAPRYEGMTPDEKLVNLAVVTGQAKDFDENDEVQVLIDSRGGDVDEGLRIREFLKNSFPKLHTKAIGKCYSIASVILTAAKPENRTSSATADFMIHNPWGGLMIEGDAAAMRKGAEDAQEYAKFLQATENMLAKMYQGDLGIDYSTLHKFMDKEVFLTPAEAKSINLVSSVDESRAFKAAAFAQFNKETMTKTSKMNKVMNAIEAFLTDTGAPVNKKAKALDTELEDGTFVRVETEAEAPAVGDMVYVIDQEGNETLAPAGDHTLATGETISVDDSGTITAVNMGDDEDEAEASATVAKLTKELKQAVQAKEEAEARAEAAEAKTKEVQAKARALRKEIADMSIEPADEADLEQVGMRAAALASDKSTGHPFDKFAKMGAHLTGHVKKRNKFQV